jgi:hypothetical protein
MLRAVLLYSIAIPEAVELFCCFLEAVLLPSFVVSDAGELLFYI